MKNIHLISTDKTTGIFKSGGNLLFSIMNKVRTTHEGFHLSITSDEEIKEGDYRLNIQRDYYKKADKEGLAYYNKRNDVFKKIILTTDQDLIADGVQSIDDEFLEWFVKNPSCDFVEVEKENICARCYSNDVDECWSAKECSDGKYLKIRYKIIIPQEELKTSEEWQNQFTSTKVLDPDGWDRKNYQYSWFEEKITLAEYESRLSKSTVKGLIPKEEPKQIKCYCGHTDYCNCGPLEESKQETLEEAFKKWSGRTQIGYDKIDVLNFGAKWQAERMYSEEDLLSAFKAGMMFIGEDKGSFREWFEQFKKK
jgi:hypothetical protein